MSTAPLNGKSTSKNPPFSLAVLAEGKHLPIEFFQQQGLHDLASGGVGIPYRRMNGTQITVKRRTALKATDGSFWPKDLPTVPYGQERLGQNTTLILVEGETDCLTLWYHGYNVMGMPGSGSAGKLTDEHLDGVSVL